MIQNKKVIARSRNGDEAIPTGLLKRWGLLRRAIALLAMTGAMGGSSIYAQSIAQKADAAMHRVFGEKSELKKETVAIDQSVMQHVKSRTGEDVRDKAIVHEALVGGKVVGYGIVDDVRGKAQPITYITLMTPDGKISDIEVLVYREPYGGEIGYETFRKQFRGKHASSKLRVGDDIQNMAGATISSKAITQGARKIVVLFDELEKEGKL